MLHLGGFAENLPGHDAACPAIHKGLTEKPFIKDNAAVYRRDAAFIAAVLNAFPHAFKNTPRVQYARRQLFFMKRRSKAEHISVKNQLCRLARADGIAVHAHDTGQSPAVRVKS